MRDQASKQVSQAQAVFSHHRPPSYKQAPRDNKQYDPMPTETTAADGGLDNVSSKSRSSKNEDVSKSVLFLKMMNDRNLMRRSIASNATCDDFKCRQRREELKIKHEQSRKARIEMEQEKYLRNTTLIAKLTHHRERMDMLQQQEQKRLEIEKDRSFSRL